MKEGSLSMPSMNYKHRIRGAIAQWHSAAIQPSVVAASRSIATPLRSHASTALRTTSIAARRVKL